MYGPTETTIWSTVSDLTHKDRVDIVRPIKNTQIYIVDEKSNVLDRRSRLFKSFSYIAL
jgi:non-ribosomal peptide synthetase component F